MKTLKKQIILLIVLPILLLAQNEVCFEIESNPNPLDPALNSFSKYVNVLDCFHIYAEPSISDAKILHAASVAAELLDNNEDGIVDDPSLEAELLSAEAMMPLFSSEWSPAMDDVWDYYDGCVSAALFNNEIDLRSLYTLNQQFTEKGLTELKEFQTRDYQFFQPSVLFQYSLLLTQMPVFCPPVIPLKFKDNLRNEGQCAFAKTYYCLKVSEP